MASFKRDNGENGIDMTRHTATGYECYANHPGNNHEQQLRVMFFARHVVGADGHPYTELGLTGLEEAERPNAMSDIKRELKAAGFLEVLSLSNGIIGIGDESLAFAEHIIPDHDGVAVRVNAGKDGIEKVVAVLGRMIFQSSQAFVKEQESVEDVLFQSILDAMGSEYDKGPGGHDNAIKKAHHLARAFEKGIEVSSSSSMVC